MDIETKIRLRAGLLLLSSVCLVIVFLIDFRIGRNIFNFTNMIVFEDWILSFISIAIFIICLENVIMQFRKSFWLDSNHELRARHVTSFIMIFIFFVTLLISLAAFTQGPISSTMSIFDKTLHEEADLSLALISIMAISLFVDEYRKVSRQIASKIYKKD